MPCLYQFSLAAGRSNGVALSGGGWIPAHSFSVAPAIVRSLAQAIGIFLWALPASIHGIRRWHAVGCSVTGLGPGSHDWPLCLED